MEKLLAISYFGHVLGEATATSRDYDTGAKTLSFSYWGLPKNEDGTVPYAATLGRTAWINDDLPQDIYYQLLGYCALNNIAVDGLWVM